jgi:hypothetical protein
MTWERAPVAAALVGILAPLDDLVSVFPAPPATFNAPAAYVSYPQVVSYDGFAFGVDTVALPVTVAAGLTESDRIDGLLATYKRALNADPSLAGSVKSGRVNLQQGWRILNVGGADFLAADLILEIRT